MEYRNRQLLRGTHLQKQRLGRVVAAARVEKGLEQQDLARLLGRTQEWGSRVERGDTTLSAFEYARVADVLKIPPDRIREIAWLGINRP